MSSNYPPTSNGTDGFNRSPRWVVLLIVCMAAITWWQNSRTSTVIAPPDQSATRTLPDAPQPEPTSDHIGHPRHHEHEPTNVEIAPEPHEPRDDDPRAADSHSKVLVENQRIRDLNGNVVFEGTIDLTPTLERIHHGGSNRHRNDGTTFQNREGRLPRKPDGYYKEYVHPTPGEHGPGPQRIIIGRQGEIWYTPDHYKTFREIEPTS